MSTRSVVFCVDVVIETIVSIIVVIIETIVSVIVVIIQIQVIVIRIVFEVSVTSVVRAHVVHIDHVRAGGIAGATRGTGVWKATIATSHRAVIWAARHRRALHKGVCAAHHSAIRAG